MATPPPPGSVSDEPDKPPPPKLPKRTRAISGFNIYCKGDKRQEGESGKDQFNRWKDGWDKLTPEERKSYEPKEKTTKEEDISDVWRRNWNFAVSHMIYCDSLIPTPSFLLYKDPSTGKMCFGGSDQGLEFIEKRPTIITRFESFLDDLEEGTRQLERKNDKQKEVRAVFNNLYRTATGSDESFQYHLIEEDGIEIIGLEALGLKLKEPQRYGTKQQETIIKNAGRLRCITKAASLSTAPSSEASTSSSATASSTAPSLTASSSAASTTQSAASSTASAPAALSTTLSSAAVAQSAASSTTSAPAALSTTLSSAAVAQPAGSSTALAPAALSTTLSSAAVAQSAASSTTSAPAALSTTLSSAAVAQPAGSSTASAPAASSTASAPAALSTTLSSAAVAQPAGSSTASAPAASSTAASTSFAASSTASIRIAHPCGNGTVIAPRETTHVILNGVRTFIEAACTIPEHPGYDPPKGQSLVKIISVYTGSYVNQTLHLVPSQNLFHFRLGPIQSKTL